MIGVIVKFQYPDSLPTEKVEKIAHTARHKFVGMPGLRSKTFTFDAAAKQAVNFYIWESRAAAESFFSPQLVDAVTGLYGVKPDLQFLEIAALVDNGSPALTAPGNILA